jgi:hypothetical protein
MNSKDSARIRSRGADEIRDYCINLGQQFGLELKHVFWGVDESPPCPDAPYKLTVKMGPQELPWFWFTRDEIEGYITGTSTRCVQDRIRKDLEARL